MNDKKGRNISAAKVTPPVVKTPPPPAEPVDAPHASLVPLSKAMKLWRAVQHRAWEIITIILTGISIVEALVISNTQTQVAGFSKLLEKSTSMDSLMNIQIQDLNSSRRLERIGQYNKLSAAVNDIVDQVATISRAQNEKI